MALSNERKGEIALAVLKNRIKGPVFLNLNVPLNSLRVDLGREVQASGVPLDELKEFVRTVIAEATEELLHLKDDEEEGG